MPRTFAAWLRACASGRTSFRCGQRQRPMRLSRSLVILMNDACEFYVVLCYLGCIWFSILVSR